MTHLFPRFVNILHSLPDVVEVFEKLSGSLLVDAHLGTHFSAPKAVVIYF